LYRTKIRFKESAKAITDFAKNLLTTPLLSQMQKTDIGKILTQIGNASTKADILDNLESIYDIVLDKQIKTSEKILDKYINLKVSGKNQAGVKVAKTVDDDTRVVIETAKKHMSGSVSDILGEAAKLTNEREDEKDEFRIRQLDNQLMGLNIAARYASTAGSAKKNIAEIEQEIDDELAKIKSNQEERTDKNGKTYFAAKEGKRDEIKKSREYIKGLESELRGEKQLLVVGLDDTIMSMSGLTKFGRLGKSLFDNAIKERKRKTNSDAKKDLADVKPDLFAKKTEKSPIQRMFDALGSPLHTFAYELRKYGRYAVNGEGYMFHRYTGGVINASQTEYDGLNEVMDRMDAKTEELFGKKWNKVMNEISNADLGTSVHVVYGDEADVDLTNGNGLYIYQVNKMADGRIKLRAMGITEADVAKIVEKLPPEMVQLGDWIQDELLPDLREKYNKTHLRLFGTQMAKIQDYVPLRILQESIHEETDVNSNEIQLPSTITGSLISRTRNKKPLDITNTDAMNLIVEHVREMEHWNAYAEITQDINTLLSNRSFRNKIESLHKGNYQLFKEAAQIAVGAYKPKETNLSGVYNALGKLAASSKITFRLNTAAKQLLSFPAFLVEAGDPAYLFRLSANFVNPKGSWTWAIENLPVFEKRWKSRFAGNEKLDFSDVSAKWIKNMQDYAGKSGMAPNAFVDALTCAVGARSIFESKQAKYLKMGYGAEQAKEKALADAAIAYNETQQSAEGLFQSAIQKDKTLFAIATSVFNNANFGYTRKMMVAARNVQKITLHGAKVIEFTKQQLIADGLSEKAATKWAKKKVYHSLYKSFAQLAMYGFALQLVWRLGNNWIYAALGDDDDKKKKDTKSAFLGAFTAPLRGFVGGATLESMVDKWINSTRRSGSMFNLHPIAQDAEKFVDSMTKAWKDKDFVAATWQIANFAGTYTTGVDVNTASNIVAGFYDLIATKDLTWQQVALDFSFIINAPPSQTRKLAEELKSGNVDAFIKEYGAFKGKYGLAFPLLKEPIYGDYYRDRFNHLRNAFEKHVSQIREDYKEAKVSDKEAMLPYKETKKYLELVHEGKIPGFSILKNKNAMNTLENAIKDIQKDISKTKDKQKIYEMNEEILKLREEQTKLAKEEIPNLEKTLKGLGIKIDL
jgi:hypothetical protein